MKFFTKNELISVTIIFIIVGAFTFSGLKTSIRRSRDAQRRADLGSISDALHKYQEEFGFFPPSENGKIKACKGDDFDQKLEEIKKEEKFDRNKFFEALSTCEWGQDSLIDVSEDSREPYLKTIPADPKGGVGISYLYLSNTGRFQIYAFLEGGEEEAGYSQTIVSRNLSCGNKICNHGKSSGDTPLDKSIEEYELELLEKSKTGKGL